MKERKKGKKKKGKKEILWGHREMLIRVATLLIGWIK